MAHVLRSAVGKTYVLRSRLVVNYTTSHFPLIVLGYPLDSKVFRLYSEIDHIHLSSEAQCVSHLLPPGGPPQHTFHCSHVCLVLGFHTRDSYFFNRKHHSKCLSLMMQTLSRVIARKNFQQKISFYPPLLDDGNPV